MVNSARPFRAGLSSPSWEPADRPRLIRMLDEQADWLGTLCVKLPDAIEKGDWRIVVHNLDDKTVVELPIILEIE
jgi:hypothetical protein